MAPVSKSGCSMASETLCKKGKSSRIMALKRTAIRMYDLTKNNRQTAIKLKIDRSNLTLWTGKMRDAIMDPSVYQNFA